MRRCQAARGKHSHLRSAAWRDLDRSTHFLEHSAVCQTWCRIRPNFPLQIGQRVAVPLRRCWVLLGMSASVLALPIDAETMRMKQRSQSYAGKRPVSKKHRPNYTRVYARDRRVWAPLRGVWREGELGGGGGRLPARLDESGGSETTAKPSAGQTVRAGRRNATWLPAARVRVGRLAFQLNRGLAAPARSWVFGRTCNRDNSVVPYKTTGSPPGIMTTALTGDVAMGAQGRSRRQVGRG
jgi:hypothetical protein